MPSCRVSRRSFLLTAAGVSSFLILPRRARGANERIRVGCIGIDGKGRSDVLWTAAAGAEIAALCDVVDPRHAAARKPPKDGESLFQKFPDAKFFTDYREMLEAMSDLDAVTISTPDHHHFHAAMLAMRKGRHVYCQKPLAHSVWEARRMAETAGAAGVVTQMGNQAHAGEPLRRGVELVRAGAVGPVTEVHAWTDRPIWPQGMSAWPKAEPVPEGLHWDLWIGPAPFREYSAAIAPFKWRGWWDFGTGALGDMGCHILDLPVWALAKGPPNRVEAWSEGGTEISGPLRSIVTWHFPTSWFGRPFKLVWYDGVKGKDGKYEFAPPEELWKADFPTPDHVFRRFDVILVGEKGRMFFGRTRTDWVFKPDSLKDEIGDPPNTIPRVPPITADGKYGGSDPSVVEWLNGIRGGPAPLSRFELSGPLTEIVLLGNVAVRVGRPVEWDSGGLRARNVPEAAALIRRRYRSGWEIEPAT
ncbi:MAG: Gfo/Idh/MocA family oxidoreductase [Kiritimatiellae bacterium]|nr:Gfo/Idh/MocA family oxidoreductase [Kiritimatiellia bacterium]